MLDKTKVFRIVKTHILKEIESVSLKKRAKRGGVIKDKMCVFTILETFVLSSINQKCQGSQIKAFL